MTNEPKEQGEENMWSFLTCYHFGLNWRSSHVLTYVYWTNFGYTLIDLLACVPYYSMHVLNKHEGLSKKKKTVLAHMEPPSSRKQAKRVRLGPKRTLLGAPDVLGEPRGGRSGPNYTRLARLGWIHGHHTL